MLCLIYTTCNSCCVITYTGADLDSLLEDVKILNTLLEQSTYHKLL